jgi:uncharacterized membrane protein HdeD (DUF308 family)
MRAEREVDMVAGLVLIIAGFLIAVYPPLLSIIVAALLIFLGATTMVAAYFDRKLSRRHENPVIELFLRF